jgi:16S rRNA U1498 N3-methylase RsmE
VTPAQLVHALSLGRDKAVSIGALAERHNVPRRSVEAAVEASRREGYPICTGPEGCWLATSVQELRQQREALRNRARTILRNSMGLRRAIAAMEQVDQVPLPWAEEAA